VFTEKELIEIKSILVCRFKRVEMPKVKAKLEKLINKIDTMLGENK